MSIEVIFREPLSLGSPHVLRLPDGSTVHDIATHRAMPVFPDEIRIGGSVIPQPLWAAVKPKPGVTVTLHTFVQGGGGGEGGGGKNLFATVAALAITVATSGIAGGAAAGLLGPSFAAGTLGATALAGTVSLVGGLLLTALTPPPVRPTGDAFDRDKRGAASANGNVLEANGPIPRVIGTRKVYPPLAVEPLTYYDDQDEVVEALYCLAGPHQMADVRVDGTPIEDAPDIEYEVLEGWDSDPLPSLVARQSKTIGSQIELTRHVLDEGSGTRIDVTVANGGIPIFHSLSTRTAPERVEIHLAFPQGLNKNGSTSTLVTVPFRIRFRQKGAVSWINGPELHYQAATQAQVRTRLELVFQDGELSDVPVAPSNTWAFASVDSPDQSVDPVAGRWQADSYFVNGAGTTPFLYRGTEATTEVANVQLSKDIARLYLDTATFPRGIYEIELIRGASFLTASFDKSDYTYSGSQTYDFFNGYLSSGALRIPESRDQIVDQCYAVRAVSIWDESPVALGNGLAMVAIRARNRRVEKVSVVASGYVPDWDGSQWANYTVTSNPAPHYRDVLAGLLNLDPIPEALIDNDELLTWRTACTAAGYTCDHIAEGQRQEELLSIIAGCGYARPFQSEKFAVARDFDRAGAAPIQIFTPRNMSGFRWAKSFTRLPDGLRANFSDTDEDEEAQQIIEYRPGVSGGTRLEQVTYEGLVEEAKIRQRAKYDLAQAEYRSVTYSWNAPVEAIVCRRGSLIGVVTEVITSRAGYGRAIGIETDGAGNLTAILTDGTVEVGGTDDVLATTDMLAVEDVLNLGLVSGVVLRGTDGTISVHQLSDTSTGDRLVLETPVANPTTTAGPLESVAPYRYEPGILYGVGDYGHEYRRMIVSAVSPGDDLTADITAVDEAAEIWEILA